VVAESEEGQLFRSVGVALRAAELLPEYPPSESEEPSSRVPIRLVLVAVAQCPAPRFLQHVFGI
jgi:hypothetical protein